MNFHLQKSNFTYLYNYNYTFKTKDPKIRHLETTRLESGNPIFSCIYNINSQVNKKRATILSSKTAHLSN